MMGRPAALSPEPLTSLLATSLTDGMAGLDATAVLLKSFVPERGLVLPELAVYEE